MARLLVVLLLGFAQSPLAREQACPPAGSDNPQVSVKSTWTGDFGGRPATCDLCANVIDLVTTPTGIVFGRCQVERFRRRKFFGVSLNDGGVSDGAICRRRSSSSRTCCTLTLPTVRFDAAHPPVALTGTMTCPRQSETTTFSLMVQ
jgi:hypothetical protein